MTQNIHETNEFKGSNPEWAARTANRLYRVWQNWKGDAEANRDSMAAEFAERHRQSYINFLARHRKANVREAVAQ